MPAKDPVYDLILLLDPAATDDVRAKIVADCTKAIEGQGTLVGHHEWGTRTTAYPILHKTEAEYHLIQFHAVPALLASLQRSLRITDGVIRFRIVKLAPGTPGPPEVRPEPRAGATAVAGEPGAPIAPDDAQAPQPVAARPADGQPDASEPADQQPPASKPADDQPAAPEAEAPEPANDQPVAGPA